MQNSKGVDFGCSSTYVGGRPADEDELQERVYTVSNSIGDTA